MSIDASTSRHAVAEALSGWDGSPIIVGGKTIDHDTAPTICDARRLTLETGDDCDAWVDVGMVSGPTRERYAAVYVYGVAIGDWRKDKRGWRFVRC